MLKENREHSSAYSNFSHQYLFPHTLIIKCSFYHSDVGSSKSSIPTLIERPGRPRYLQPSVQIHPVAGRDRAGSKPEERVGGGGISRTRHTIHHHHMGTRHKEFSSNLHEMHLSPRQVSEGACTCLASP